MGRILFTIAVFVLINSVLHFGQEWYYNGDVSKIEFLKGKIDAQKHEYIRLELQLENFIKKAETAKSDSDWNDLNDKYNDIKRKYEFAIQVYNANVEEYNRLTKACATRWYIIPIPCLGGKK